MNTNARPIDLVLPLLSAVKKSSQGWSARCPAHEDKANSLSVGEGNDGRVLINCFAGCKTEVIVGKIGLGMRDLFPSNGKSRQSYSRRPQSLTTAELAEAKKLPEGFLKELGVQTLLGENGREIVRITYKLLDGSLAPRQRIRKALSPTYAQNP